MSDIKGLDIFEGESREWSRKAGQLRMKAGTGMIGALEGWYKSWKKKPTDRNRRETLTWRLRLHRKWNSQPDFLRELNEYFEIGLMDEEVGPMYWEVGHEHATSWSPGFNWRRDSGNALRGGKSKETSSQCE